MYTFSRIRRNGFRRNGSIPLWKDILMSLFTPYTPFSLYLYLSDADPFGNIALISVIPTPNSHTVHNQRRIVSYRIELL